MKKKNLSYKFSGYGEDATITHNIENIINVDDIKLNFKREYEWSNDYLIPYISHEIFNKVVQKNIIWPTEEPYISEKENEKYLGAAVIRTNDNRDILSYFIENAGLITIDAVDYLTNIKGGKKHNKYRVFPQRNVRCFETIQELEEDKDKKAKKNQGSALHSRENADELRKQIPSFNFKTPKFKVLEIYTKTACAPKLKVGDIIHGELEVITRDKKGNLHEMLHGDSCNYVNVFINDINVKSISPTFFQNMFLYNFRVKQID